MADNLEQFMKWWLKNRPFNTPTDAQMDYYGVLRGVVLYRKDNFQVQLFMLPPNSNIDAHIHPNVDSYEVYISGDINFMCNDEWFTPTEVGASIRIFPNSWHGGKFGERGGCFISIQKWLNGVPPTSVGADWRDKKNNTIGNAVNSKDMVCL
jgi:quercetin dioxygenase-like cupin family protein